LRAADVHAFVRSRRKFAWAVAMLETHSMSLDPGPRSRESETALRVDFADPLLGRLDAGLGGLRLSSLR
jgi:hypothetical protein